MNALQLPMLQLKVENLSKTFVLHHQHGIRLPVLHQTSLEVGSGECVWCCTAIPAAENPLFCALYMPITYPTTAISG